MIQRTFNFFYTPPSEQTECSICYNPISQNLTKIPEIPIQHEGPDGEKHQPVHLKCYLEWITQSDLCIFCKQPINGRQLTLLSDFLVTNDSLSLSPETLASAIEICKTESCEVRGKIYCELKTFEAAKKRFTPHIEDLQVKAISYKSWIERATEQQKNQIKASSKEEDEVEETNYLQVENFLLPDAESAYEISQVEHLKAKEPFLHSELELIGLFREATILSQNEKILKIEKLQHDYQQIKEEVSLLSLKLSETQDELSSAITSYEKSKKLLHKRRHSAKETTFFLLIIPPLIEIVLAYFRSDQIESLAGRATLYLATSASLLLLASISCIKAQNNPIHNHVEEFILYKTQLFRKV